MLGCLLKQNFWSMDVLVRYFKGVTMVKDKGEKDMKLPPLAFMKIWIIYRLISRWLLTFFFIFFVCFVIVVIIITSPLFTSLRFNFIHYSSNSFQNAENYWPWVRVEFRVAEELFKKRVLCKKPQTHCS